MRGERNIHKTMLLIIGIVILVLGLLPLIEPYLAVDMTLEDNVINIVLLVAGVVAIYFGVKGDGMGRR